MNEHAGAREFRQTTRSRRRTWAWLLLALPLALQAQTFTDNFASGVNATYWTTFQATPGLYTVNTGGGNVQFNWAGTTNPGGLQNAGLRLNLGAFGLSSIAGDFSTQIDFSGAVLPGTTDQVELHLMFANTSVLYDVRDNFGGANVHVWNGSAPVGTQSFSDNFGTFTLSRVGSTVSAAINGSTFYSTTNSSALTIIEFVLQNNQGSSSSTAVTFDNFSLTATGIPEPGTSALWLAVGAAGMMFVVGRRRRAS